MLDLKSLPQPDQPEEALAAAVALRVLAEKLEREAVENAIKQGWSWSQVAEALGISRQAAHKRFAPLISTSRYGDMIMFKRIKMRIRDVRTVSKLIAGADEEAHLCGEEKPGAEHFFLSAFKLSDHTAQNVFDRLDLKPDQFREAITKQYHDALKSVGIDTSIADLHSEPIEPDQTIHNSKPSGQAVMKALYSLKKTDKNRPLLGAHVLSVVANMQYGVASRALKTMGIDQKQLTSAIKEELASYPG